MSTEKSDAFRKSGRHDDHHRNASLNGLCMLNLDLESFRSFHYFSVDRRNDWKTMVWMKKSPCTVNMGSVIKQTGLVLPGLVWA